jgi:hypothetical protein
VKTVYHKTRAGFNLVETIVASMILSAAVLTLGAISTNALVDTRLNQHYRAAAALMDKQLHYIDFIGIDQFIEQEQMEGFEQEIEPGYQWQVATEYYGVDNVYLVTITVSWMEGTRPYQLTTQTMLNGASLIASDTTEER